MKNVIIVPCYNPNEEFLDFMKKLSRKFPRIIVVDDGSYKNAEIFDKLPKRVFVVHHQFNRGKGTAIKTAMTRYGEKWQKATGFITVDSDGQHSISDIKKIDKHLKQNLLLGVRDFSGENVPKRSRIGNLITAKFFKMATGVSISDTQTGLRGIPIAYKNKLLKTEGSRYELEMNFLVDVAREGNPIDQIPIATIYEDNNKSSHFNTFKDSFLVYKRFIKFALSSVLSALVDLSVFTILTSLGAMPFGATIVARFMSGAVNFSINKRIVYQNAGEKTLVKYFALFVAKMVASGIIIQFISFLTFNLTFLKALVDIALFFVSFSIQNRFIFIDKKINK